MTTYIAFTPQQNQNFQFQPVLGGITYIAICTYNFYFERYYLSIYDTSRSLILITPIVPSPDNYDINLITGYFKNSTLVYREITGNFEISP